jgi:hypothetical protein
MFNYNEDGMAHMGLVPDFIADMRVVGLSVDDLRPLFRSAEAYVALWERIERVAQVVYVDANVVGCGGGTAQSPYGSVQRALDTLDVGKTMVMAPGTYAEPIVIDEPVVMVGLDRATWNDH